MMRSPSLTRALAHSHAPSRRLLLSRSLLCWTAAAALGSSNAFAPSHRAKNTVAPFGIPPPMQQQPLRLYSSRRDDEGFLGKAADAVKGLLPNKWFQSKEEKEKELARKRVRKEVKGGLTELLKDAPLPVRMVGSLMAPIMSTMASSLSEAMSEQQQQMEDLLDDARTYMVRDDAAAQALGEPIEVQNPFSQSSSTTSINGKTTSQIQASFQVQGSVQTGTATMTATENGISNLVLQVGGRNINVNLSKKRGGRGGYTQHLGQNRIDNDDVIDVEFVEKK